MLIGCDFVPQLVSNSFKAEYGADVAFNVKLGETTVFSNENTCGALIVGTLLPRVAYIDLSDLC